MHNWDGPEKWKFELKVPDYRKYKVDGIVQLELARDILARRGLKDPWLRNQVWRYPEWFEHPQKQLSTLFFRGMKPALALVALTIAGQEFYWSKYGRPAHIHNAWQFMFHPHPIPDTRRIE